MRSPSLFVSKSRSGLILLIALMAGSAALAGCTTRAARPRLAYEERPVEALYNAGHNRLSRERWSDAVDYFQEVERQHPYSEWSRRAILMQIYANYQNNRFEEAIAAADRFIQLFPGNPSAAYAFYMRALCNFERIVDVGRDQAYAEQALQGLRDVARRYPGTPYASDALVKIDMVNDQLAGKEMAIGRYYQSKNQPLAAINRYKTVVENDDFQRTSHTPEALYRLVEIYVGLGLTEEATRNGAVLGHNYPGNVWYSRAYALLTSKGLSAEGEAPPRREGWLSRLIPG
ncbi:MAG: outer membrane protein assembly factor BamD [Brevundimonas sp.]|uniref:outer membrane protein assembly factor BamD n=1 Tax=Brevundimonas sp. TaxID=1871086 RepID=UPI0025BF583A|nr:outer membrane protein assembly factor BamD [Brevundimonas sp.]MBX3478527.1 outer membrane protein assembly factor BamD [Brevundimonas sp.]